MKTNIEKLVSYIRENYNERDYNFFANLDHSHKIIREIATHLFGNDNYQARYTLIKVFKRNTGNVRQLLSNNKHCDSVSNEIVKHQQNTSKLIIDFKNVINTENITEQQLNESYCSFSSIYGLVCATLGKKIRKGIVVI